MRGAEPVQPVRGRINHAASEQGLDLAGSAIGSVERTAVVEWAAVSGRLEVASAERLISSRRANPVSRGLADHRRGLDGRAGEVGSHPGAGVRS